jgi:serine/threonine protein kinase
MPHLQPNIIFAGRYTLLEKLGIGGYSEVWNASDNMANEMLVALKIFAPDKGMDQNGIQVFSKQYGLVFNLNHPNLLKPSHYDIWEGSPYLVMPYCKNRSVYSKLGEISETEVLRFIQQAASALNYLHTLPTPIIHQDIKPDNFLIDDNGNYLLSDFGISSRLRRTLTRSVGAASSAGTLAYMPPERFGREQQIIPASDIFSLGVTVFELLTERQPFGEHGGLILNTGAVVPDLPKSFSLGLNSLVRSCMDADPALRPDAATLVINVTKLLGNVETGLHSNKRDWSTTGSRSTRPIPNTPIPSKPKISERKSKKIRYKVPVLLSIIPAVALLFFVLMYLIKNKTSVDNIQNYRSNTGTVVKHINTASSNTTGTKSAKKAQSNNAASAPKYITVHNVNGGTRKVIIRNNEIYDAVTGKKLRIVRTNTIAKPTTSSTAKTTTPSLTSADQKAIDAYRESKRKK